MDKNETLKMMLNSINAESTVNDNLLSVRGFNKATANILMIIMSLIGVIMFIIGFTLAKSDKIAMIIMPIVGIICLSVAYYCYRLKDTRLVIDKKKGFVIKEYKGNEKNIFTITDYKNLRFSFSSMVTNIYIQNKNNKKVFLASYKHSKQQKNFVEEFNNAFNNWLLS